MTLQEFKALGSPADWLGDMVGLAGLILIVSAFYIFAGALIDTPEKSLQTSITTNHYNGE